MTTRTLVILRHAKAATPDGVADVDRPLTGRGHADAAVAGAWLAHRGLLPDVVVCSSSRRTRETWHGVALALATTPPVRYLDVLYAGSLDDLVEVVRSVPEDVATALLIGHNPGVSQLSALLDPDLADPEGLRTATAAVHTWDGHWADCEPGLARLAGAHTARA